MNAPSEDVKDMLEAESSLGLTFATDLFVSDTPDSPDECVVVFDTGGEDPAAQHTYEKPTVQIRVRGRKGDYLNAYALAGDVKNVLHGLTDEVLNGARYIGIWAVGDVLFLGQDDNKRPLLTINFRLHRTDV
jgi:hypothetical protein